MVNDFDEFLVQFRRRTTARLLEFEKALEKAQRETENAVANRHNASTANRVTTKPIAIAQPAQHQQRVQAESEGSIKKTPPARVNAGRTGQVRSVLRKN